MSSATINDSAMNTVPKLIPKRELRFLKRSTLDALDNMIKVLELNNVELFQLGENIIHELFSQFVANITESTYKSTRPTGIYYEY
jgi:hypothetical protein